MNVDRASEIGHEHHGSSDDPSLLDFSANVNPLVPDGVEAVYIDALEGARRYPTEPPEHFRRHAAASVDCHPSEVVPTPGGLSAIRLAISVTVSRGASVLVPAPSFAEYAREVRLQGGEPVFVPHDELLAANPSPHSLAIVCHPNNPTGELCDPEALRAFANRCVAGGTPLLVDEAFLGFTARPSLAGKDGVIVARSLTKLYGLPGIRSGFAVATGRYRDALAGARQPWNVSQPALATGSYCLQQPDFVQETRERVASERNRLRERLSDRFDVYPSDSPFLLLDVRDRTAESVCERARADGIAIRDATTFRGLDSHVRLAVRLPEENDRLLEVLERV